MIAVSGVGRVVGSPDVVRLRLAASVLRPTAADALAATEAAAAAVRSVLAGHGVTGADAASGLFRLMAEQAWTEQGPRITGYRCDHEIRAVVRQVPAVGRVLADVLMAGGDAVRVDGVDPGVEDDAALRVRARELAWADALDRATRLAALAGRSLGRVASITEGSAAAPPVPLAEAKMLHMAAGAADVSVQPGDVDVVVTLTCQWELG
jgi:uncharacterized protein